MMQSRPLPSNLSKQMSNRRVLRWSRHLHLRAGEKGTENSLHVVVDGKQHSDPIVDSSARSHGGSREETEESNAHKTFRLQKNKRSRLTCRAGVLSPKEYPDGKDRIRKASPCVAQTFQWVTPLPSAATATEETAKWGWKRE